MIIRQCRFGTRRDKQANGTDSRNRSKHTVTWLMTKMTTQWKTIFPINGDGATRQPHGKKWNLTSTPYYAQNQFQVDYRSKSEKENNKTSRRKHRRISLWPWGRQRLGRTQQILIRINEKLVFIKIKIKNCFLKRQIAD